MPLRRRARWLPEPRIAPSKGVSGAFWLAWEARYVRFH